MSTGEETVVRPVELLRVAHVEDVLLALSDLGALEERRPEASAVQAICPAVIRAPEEALDVDRAFVDELRAAVSACGPLIVLSGVTIPSAAATASSIVLIHLRDD